MNFSELVENTRSCRRFLKKPLSDGFLEYLISIARVCPSGRNLQPLKYITVESEDYKNKLFPHLRWAGALKEWDGPDENERPAAYVALILDKSLSSSSGLDAGIVAQTLQLAAMDKGISSCMIGAFIKDKVSEVLGLKDNEDIQLILALGYADEKRVLVEALNTEEINYYRDADLVHYIPKRSVEDLTIKKL